VQLDAQSIVLGESTATDLVSMHVFTCFRVGHFADVCKIYFKISVVEQIFGSDKAERSVLARCVINDRRKKQPKQAVRAIT
jgi:hypothetical protein